MKRFGTKGGLSSFALAAGILLATAAGGGLLAYAAGEGSFTSGGFTLKSNSVHDPRNTQEQYPALGQLIKNANTTPPEWSLKIEVNQMKPNGTVTINIMDTPENLAKAPRTYKLYSEETLHDRKRPYATITIKGSTGFDSYTCNPKMDKEDDDAAGSLTLESFGKVDGAITGKLDIKEGWAVPANCDKLKIAKTATFHVQRAVDYIFN